MTSTRALIGLALAALVGSAGYVLLETLGGTEPDPARDVALTWVEIRSQTVRASERRAEPHAARDGAIVEGRLVVATATGLRVPGQDVVLGFGEGEVTAMTVHAGRAVLGADDGSVTLVDGREGERLDLGLDAPVDELASDGERLFVGGSQGLVIWDGERATKPVESLGAITAMAVGPRGVAIGTADGLLYLARGGRLERLPTRLSDRVTALAWDGEALLAGTPFALTRVAHGQLRTLRRGLHVAAILVDGGRVYLGTLNEGVLELDGSGRERRLVGGESVRRLRWIDGRPVVFGDGGAWDLSGPA